MASNDLGAFKLIAGIAFGIVVAVHVQHVLTSGDAGILLAGNLMVLLTLAIVAVREQGRNPAFSSAVAAETIVAFGVLALILGLVAALVPLMWEKPEALGFDAATVRRVGLPFAQGLAAAGLAPVIAVLVRINGAGVSVDALDEADLAAAAALREAMMLLTVELKTTRGAAGQFNKALTDAGAKTAQIAPDVAQHLAAVALAAGQVGPAIAGSLATASTAIDVAGSALADEINKAAASVAGGFGDTQTQMASLAAATQAGVADLNRLSGALGTLSTNAQETAGLLDALNTLTASVERFLARHRAP